MSDTVNKKALSFRVSAHHILYGISLANALRLGWAYAVADAGGQVLSVPGAFGALLGLSISMGTAFVAGKLGGKLTKLRTTIIWVVLVLLLVLEPVILAPITRTHMTATMETTLGAVMSWVWAAILALVPSLVLAGVSIANGGLIEATASAGGGSANVPAGQGAGSATGAPQSVAGAVRTAKGPKSAKQGAAEVQSDMRECGEPGCGILYKWPQGKGAHYKKHHPDLIIQKGIPAQTVLPINQPAEKS